MKLSPLYIAGALMGASLISLGVLLWNHFSLENNAENSLILLFALFSFLGSVVINSIHSD